MRVLILLLCLVPAGFGQGIFDSHDAHFVWRRRIDSAAPSDTNVLCWDLANNKIKWCAVTSGTPGGSSGQIQYNNSGAFGGVTLVPLANGGTNCATPYAVNPQTSTYQALLADFTCSKTISVASGTFTITLVASGGQPVAGSWIRILNYGSGVVTVARSGQNINGATTSHTLAAGSATAPTGIIVQSDGTNYFAQDIVSGAASGVASVGGLTGVIGVTSGITVSGTDLVFDASVLSGVFANLTVTNSYTAGARQVFVPSSTTPGWRTTAGSFASFSTGGGTPLLAGDEAMDLSGHRAVFTGTNLDAYVTFAGSGAALATAPTATHMVKWGANYQVVTTGAATWATADLPVALANQTSLRGNAMAAAAGDATIGQVIAHGATALNFASTATGACATVLTATATGAASTDVIIFNANASIKAVTGFVPAATGGFSIAAFPTTDTANFEACNWTAGTVDPGSITVNWVVIR